MTSFRSTKARRVLAALERNGFEDHLFAYHDSDEIGPAMLKKIAARTGLRAEDL